MTRKALEKLILDFQKSVYGSDTLDSVDWVIDEIYKKMNTRFYYEVSYDDGQREKTKEFKTLQEAIKWNTEHMGNNGFIFKCYKKKRIK